MPPSRATQKNQAPSMQLATRPPPVCTSEKTTFAYSTATERWPIILTTAIDDMYRAVSRSMGEDRQREGKQILRELATMKYELEHDKLLSPLLDDGEQDLLIYNHELRRRGAISWHNAPWLFTECYLYRRMSSYYNLSRYWKDYDVFMFQKQASFRASRRAVVEIAIRYTELNEDMRQSNNKRSELPPHLQEEADKMLFTEMTDICLWGNATDLSLLTDLSYDDIHRIQGSEARKRAEANILVNELPAAWEVLSRARREKPTGDRRVDIVLDNAGFELYVDLILAGYLLASNLATVVVLHPKSIPWFVSDTLPQDFGELLTLLAEPQNFFISDGKSTPHLSEREAHQLKYLFSQWGNFHAEGQLILRPNRFWTSGSSYWDLPTEAPGLYDDLKSSELVIFKGDLNYRKLTSDCHWPPTTPFATAIGPLGPTSQVRILALRTCKADVVVGLKEGMDEHLRALPDGGGDSGARKWAWSGKWAVIQFCDGKLKP